MSRKLRKSEPLVLKYFNEFCRFDVEPLVEGTIDGVKTPDFFVKVSNGPAFFCEVKSLNPSVSDKDALSTQAMYNKVSRDLDDCIEKFHCANKQREFPNIVAWTSKEMRYDLNLLVDFYQRALYTDANVMLGSVSPRFYGNQRNERMFVVDAHLYFDERDASPKACFFISSKRDQFKLQLAQIFSPLMESIGYARENERFGMLKHLGA